MPDKLILSPMPLVEIRPHKVQRDDKVWRHHPDDVVVPGREGGSPFLAVLLDRLSTSVVQYPLNRDLAFRKFESETNGSC